MKKIRIGIFETNSSSTHTCVICKKSDYEKWINGEYAYINSISSVNTLAELGGCKDGIHGNFFEVERMRDIPLSSIFEVICRRDVPEDVKKNCEKFSVYDMYSLLLDTEESNWKDSWDYYSDQEVYYDEENKNQVELIECLKKICYGADELTNQDLFEIIADVGFYSSEKISDAYESETWVSSENIDGIEIMSITEYGSN